MYSGNVKAAITNLRQSKWRSLLTMMGIIIGVSSVITVISLGEGLKNQIVGQINHLGDDIITIRSGKLVSGENGNLSLLGFLNASTLTDDDVNAISKLSSVQSVAPMDFLTNSVIGNKGELDNVYVMGTSPNLPSILNQQINYGQFFSEDELSQYHAIIGANISQKLFGSANPVGHSFKIDGQDFVVEGVFKPSAGGLLSIAQTDINSSVFIPLPIAESLASDHTNLLQILAKSESAGMADKAVADIRSALYGTHGGVDNFTVLKQNDLLNLTTGVIDTFTAFISAIAAISLLVGGLGIMDIMLVNVSERTREIGVRKAVGATNRQVLNQFLVEGLALTLTGGAIGILFALLINFLLRIYTSLQPAITIWIMLLAVFISVSVGIAFSVIPALKAARKSPIDALRGE